MAAFPRRLTGWRAHGLDGTTRIEPNETRILMMRVAGVVVAAVALVTGFGAFTILP